MVSVQVQEIQNGHIALMDGRSLPDGFSAFTHGYAVTSHSSQGKTVDEVLLVPSSRSFGAVNREQFYVSISRGRERVHVFTDDAGLLALRVTDSHERQAAIELQALRDDLAKLGFRAPQQLKEELASPVVNELRAMRRVREMRVTRLSPVQRLANFVENVRRQLDEWFGIEAKETVTKRAEQTESVKQMEALKPSEMVKAPRPVNEAIQQREAARRKLSLGVLPRRDTGHSRGMGV